MTDIPAPTLKEVCKSHGGIEDAELGEFAFCSGTEAARACAMLGLELTYHPQFEPREWRLKPLRRKLLAKCPAETGDVPPGRYYLLKRRCWTTTLGVVESQVDPAIMASLDECCRYKVADGKSQGFSILHANRTWLHNIDNHLAGCYLTARNFDGVDVLKGAMVSRPWKIVNVPFAPEEPGDRTWNYNAPQFTFAPKPGSCLHWGAILSHVGRGLDEAIATNEWAERNGIKTGADYLLAWTAYMLRDPFQPLPYLFLYSASQNTGKSSYHEALSLLMTKGAVSADRALTNSNDFNGELANAVLAYIEEKDIARSPSAYAKIKDWTTSPTLAIRRMHTDQYTQRNTLHFIQCANDPQACPADGTDTRITMIHVPELTTEIPKAVLFDRLREEAPAFMHRVLNLKLPPIEGRLALPVIVTDFKTMQVENGTHEFVRAVAEHMVEHKTVTLTASGFDVLGVGDWPKTMRSARKIIEANASYLATRGIRFNFPSHRTAKGFTLELSAA